MRGASVPCLPLFFADVSPPRQPVSFPPLPAAPPAFSFSPQRVSHSAAWLVPHGPATGPPWQLAHVNMINNLFEKRKQKQATCTQHEKAYSSNVMCQLWII